MLENHFELQPSRQFSVLLSCVILGCIAIIAFLPIMTGYKLLLILVVLYYGKNLLWRYGLLLHPQSLVRLEIKPDGTWTLTNKQNEIFHGVLQGDSTITHWVSVLRFLVRNKQLKRSCVVFQDMLKEDGYRKFLLGMQS